MLNYVIRRLLYMIPTVFGVALLVFILFSVAGEDPVRVYLGKHASEQAILDMRVQWGLDRSLPMQFLDFLRQIVTFDYGESWSRPGVQLSEMFAEGAKVSLALTVPPFVIGLAIYIAMAMFVAYYRETWADRFATAGTVIAMSISYLVYIITLQYALTYEWDIFPVCGYADGFEAVRYLALPWIIFFIVALGPDVRIFRTVFLDEMGADYVRTARAKGVSEPGVLFGHVLKNAMIPILTYTVVVVPFLILGAFLMERFFSLPGVGDMMINAINTGDFPVLKGLTMFIAIAYSIFNLLTDVLYALVDPRVKLS